MADIKALLLNGEEGFGSDPDGGQDVEVEDEVAVSSGKAFTDRLILLKQLRALVRRTERC